LDPLGNIDGKLAALLATALTTTIGTGLVHHLAATLTDRAGPLDGEKPLRRPHLAVAGALPTRMGAGSRLGARAFAGLAGCKAGHVNLDGASVKALFERDLEIIAQVRTARAGRAALPPAATA